MILLQLSAAQGPAECCLAVEHAMKLFEREASETDVSFSIVECVAGPKQRTVKSVLYQIEGPSSKTFAEKWSGTMQWICQSPYRPKHKRKNWFFAGSFSEHSETIFSKAISFEACRSSGPGGQHTNKTSSAVRAIHVETGISVKVQSERSQHMNKRLAKALIEFKLAEIKNEAVYQDKSRRHQSHHLIERGNAKRIFSGTKFDE